VNELIRARVDEIQWGGSVMPYVGYFEDGKAVEAFVEKTAYVVTTNVVGEFEGKGYIMEYSFDTTGFVPTTIEGDFTDEEKLQIMNAWEIENL
jgi:hypothetical protein